MSGNRHILADAVVRNDAGSAISGVQFYFYTPGTTTPKTIYTDEALATPANNPQSTNSTGRIEDIWLDGLYDVLMVDPLSRVPTKTYANVAGIGFANSVNINNLKKIRIEEQAGYYGDYNPSTRTGTSDHVAWQAVLQKMLDDPTAVFEGNGKTVYQNVQIGEMAAPYNARFYGNGTTFYADTRPGGSHNASGGGLILQRNAIDPLYEEFIIDGMADNVIVALTQSAGIATATTLEDHGYVVNQLAALWDVEIPSSATSTQDRMLCQTQYNRRVTVLSTPTSKTFTFAVLAATPANPVVTRARCSYTKDTLAGGDGLRLFNPQRGMALKCTFKSVYDSWLRVTSSTDTGSFASIVGASVSANDFIVKDCTTINCWQGSNTPGGAGRMRLINHTCLYNSGGTAFKFASRLEGGGTFEFDGVVVDSVNRASGGFDAAAPFANVTQTLVLEGAEYGRINVISEGVVDGIVGLPNGNGGATTATRKTCKDFKVNVMARNCGHPNTRRWFPAVRFEDSSYQTGLADATRNIAIDVHVIGQKGRAVEIGNNVGWLQGFDIKGKVAESIGAMRFRVLNGGYSHFDLRYDGTNAPGDYAWVNGRTYQYFENMTANGTVWRCEATPGTASTVAPIGNGTVVTADGYTWKNQGSDHAIAVSADESPNLLSNITGRLKAENNPNGGGIYVSKLSHSKLSLIANSNTGIGINEGSCEDCEFEYFAHNNTLSGINSGNMKRHVYLSTDIDMGGSSSVPHSNGGFEDIVFYRRIYRNATSTAGINITTSRPNGVRFMEPAIQINCSTAFDVLCIGLGYKHFQDKNFFNIEVPSLTSIGTFSGGSRLRLGNFGGGVPANKGGASAGSIDYDVELGGAYYNNAYAAGAPPAASTLAGTRVFTSSAGWNATNNNITGATTGYIVVNFGEPGATGNLDTEPVADMWGILDGATVNTNAHWHFFGYSDSGNATAPLHASGQSVAPGVFRLSGVDVSSLTGDGTTLTCVSTGHGLTTGNTGYITRAASSTFRSPTDTSGFYVPETITVIDPNTFTITRAGSGVGTAAVLAGEPSIVFALGQYEMCAPNTRTTGSTRPTGRGIVSNNYFLRVNPQRTHVAV